ncbi:MAG: DUF1269 domain-containing protein [Steroidobacteraceae bacterium]
MKRLCFLSSDVEMTRQLVAVLHRAGVDESSMMVVARHDIRLDELPPSGSGRTDAIPGLARGLAAGGVLGSLAGLAILSFEQLGFALGGAAIPLLALLGAAVSGLGGFLAGASIPSSRLKRFEQAIERDGKILLMLEVEKERGKTLEAIAKDEVPEVECVGFEPRAPFIP